MRLSLPLSALLVFSAVAFHTQAQEPALPPPGPREEVNIGGRKVRVPAPPGFRRVDGLNIEEDRQEQSLLPETNRYVARFEHATPVEPDDGRSFNVQVLRSLENLEIGEKTFAQFRDQTKASLDTMQEKVKQEAARVSAEATKAMQDSTGADAALSVSDMVVLGYFGEDASSLGFTMAMNVAAQAGAAAGGEQVKAKLVVASMIVPVNGRLIYLYANSVFNSPADRQWAESAVQAWRDSLLAVNPRVQGFDFADLGKFGKSGLIGAGLGALLGIILIILRKSRS